MSKLIYSVIFIDIKVTFFGCYLWNMIIGEIGVIQ
jgi:hypothetical protein